MSTEKQEKIRPKIRPGEIILYDSRGYRRYRPITKAYIEVAAAIGIKIESYNDFDMFGFANRVEIEINKTLLNVKFKCDHETKDKILLYNANESMIDEVLNGFAVVFTRKYMVSISMDAQNTVANGYGINISIDRITTYKELYYNDLSLGQIKIRRI